MATTPTSRQDDMLRRLGERIQAAKLAHANSKPELPTNPQESPVFYIPRYMNPPQVRPIYDHYVRIWRAPTIELTKNDWWRCVGLMEFTPLKEDDGLTLGLEWYYSAHQRPEWEKYSYRLFSHFPGDQPCKDLVDVYRSCSLEIRWAIVKLQGPEGLKLYRLQHKNKNGCHETIHDAETGERIA